MFPRSWYTIPQGGLQIVVDSTSCYDTPLFKDREPLYEEYVYLTRIHIKSGYYNSMEELVLEMNRAAEQAFGHTKRIVGSPVSPPVFCYKHIGRRMCLTLQGGMGLEFEPALETILGLSPQQNPLYNSAPFIITVEGHNWCDLQAGIHALYIYCDLLQFTHVGNIKAPLLRVVDSEGETGGAVTRYYDRPRYDPLQRKNFDSIQIVIRDDLGKKIPFESGKVLLTLHFRRTQNNYLI